MRDNNVFYTIRQVAATGVLTEHALRLMSKQGRLPQVMNGNRVLINFNLLQEWINDPTSRLYS